MTQQRLQRIQSVLRQRQTDATVLLDQVHKPHNLAAIMRTADATGLSTVHAIECSGHVRIYRNAAGGCQRSIDLNIHQDRLATLQRFRDEGKTLYAAHLSEEAVDFREVDYTQPCVIVMGAERDGVSDETAEFVDQHIIVPMKGMVESLNVSVATALILFELQHQRQQAGLYDTPQFSEAEIKRRIFEYLQPKMTRYCKQHNLPYPELDEDGDLVTAPK